ncbi:hypothetical protein PsyrH_19730 [Pseudomonas syringae pv. syringae HS191]|nr:hypothetical protein PsyrH_19730 [Pseudomonas syringae pv. syringae HS191]
MQEMVTAKGFAAAERAEKRRGLSEFRHASFFETCRGFGSRKISGYFRASLEKSATFCIASGNFAFLDGLKRWFGRSRAGLL